MSVRIYLKRLHVQGKRRDISIGTYPAVTLSEARERAHDNRLTAKRGGDPSGRASTVPTFAAVSAKVEQGGQWRGRTRETRRRTLARYAARLMGRPVDPIDRAAVLAVLGNARFEHRIFPVAAPEPCGSAAAGTAAAAGRPPLRPIDRLAAGPLPSIHIECHRIATACG